MIRKSSVALSVVCALLFEFTARAQELTPAEKDKALAYLESTKKDVLDATKSLSPAQWNFKAAPDRWSIAECMEHIAAAEDFIRGNVETGIMKAPPAPGPIKPPNRFGSPQAAIDPFVESRATTENSLKTTTGLRDHAAESPNGQ